MAWTKNLGKVKGEDGDVYLPDISIVNGKLHFGWERKTKEEVENILQYGKDLTMPLYIPDYNSETGKITFSLSQTVTLPSGEPQAPVLGPWEIKGETGQTYSVFNIQHFNENSVNDISNPESGIIYIKGSKAWIYDEQEDEFFMLEGLDFTDYYKNTEVYNKNEIDEMFNEAATQVELIYRLLEIEETILSNEELGE